MGWNEVPRRNLTRKTRTIGHPFLPIAREGARWGKEKAMKQFAALLRKDNRPVRYLVVDDSVFARIVMVSSVGYQENILAALQKGAKHFVQKPVKPEVLYEILRYVLSDDPNATGVPVALAGESRS